MEKTLRIQTASVISIAGTAVLAEISAWLLDRFPSSSILWYINLEYFRVMDFGFQIIGRMLHVGSVSMILILFSIIAVSLWAYRQRQRFALAVLVHGCFVVCAALLSKWLITIEPRQEASLRLLNTAVDGNSAIMTILVFGSFVGILIAHMSYCGEILARLRGLLAWRH